MKLHELLNVICVNQNIKIYGINEQRIKRTVAEFKNYSKRVEALKDVLENNIIHVQVEDNTTMILIKE